MAIKRKKTGPLPRALEFPLEWQNLAFQGDAIEAVKAFRKMAPGTDLPEASRKVRAFMTTHQVTALPGTRKR